LAEWLYEEGIGENRAILVEGGAIIEAAIELPGGPAVGSVVEARLARILVPGRRGLAALEGGLAAVVEPLPAALTEGQTLHVEIVREAIAEPGRAKLAKARWTEAAVQAGPSLHDRIGRPASRPDHGPDLFEEAGWSELLEEAASGEIAFSGGSLRMSLTPAMTLFDVDGTVPPPDLAIAGAAAAARAIRRLAIGGSIGIDLPTLPARADRQRAAQALDALLPQPFERTAVNGFGFLQIVRRRERPSIAEIVQHDRAGAAARALLRRAGRSAGAGERTIRAAPAVIERIGANPGWTEALSRRIGAAIRLRAEPGLPISGGDVQSAHS
jgi:Ribonuclease G/E